VTEIRLHPLGEPVPPGWKLAQNREVLHHNRHKVLIEPIKRKNGKHWLLEHMPIGWQTSRALSRMLHRDRNVVSVLLLRALRAALVERRPSECPHCGERMFEWRRK
jgi:hypothetical protein